MLRRDGRLFRRGVIPALVLSLLLAAVIAAASFAVLQGASAGAARAEVLLVDQEDSLYSRIAISTVEAQSYIDSLLHIESADDEDEAIARLNAGECAAVIILPEGYLNDIMVGNAAKGRIILSDAAAASADIVASVALFGERLLAAGQYGVFAGQKLIWNHGLSADFEKNFLLVSNTGLMDAALSLYDEAFAVETTAYDGTSLSITAYYAVAWLVLFFTLAGLFFMGLYLSDNRSDMLTRLYALGVTPGRFFLGKWLWPLLFHSIFAILLLVALSRVLPLTLTVFSLLLFLLGLLVLSQFVSCLSVMFADRGLAFGSISAMAVTGLFLAGGIIPRSMLSRSLTVVGRFFPSGLVSACFAPLFGGKADWLCIALAAALAGLLYVLTLRVLAKRPIGRGGDLES